ncbi:MAG: transposase [Verrucomicrobiota bacterium]
MARALRIEYPGAFYHVMARGNRRGSLFPKDEDCVLFLDTLGEACVKSGWRVHGWVLMGNHYHLLLETPRANLVEGMKWLQNTYTRRFNVRHRGWGRLFGDRYKAVIVQSEEGTYYETLLDYIHLNPVRAGRVRLVSKSEASVADYPWSSVAQGYALPAGKRASWLAVLDGLAAFGLSDRPSGRAAFVARLDERARSEKVRDCGKSLLRERGDGETAEDGRLSDLGRGWYWGTRDFAEVMLERFGSTSRRRQSRNYRSSGLERDYASGDAERVVRTGMEYFGLARAELERLPGAHVGKCAMGLVITQRTTVSMAWIAERLSMKSAANASQQIRLFRRKLEGGEIPREVARWVRNQLRNVA